MTTKKFEHYQNQFFLYFFKSINYIKEFLKNEKKQFSKIIKDAWVEYQMTDLFKISIFLILILWICYQAYYDTTQSHVSYQEYSELKKTINELIQLNAVQEETLKEQHDTMNKMAKMVKIYKARSVAIDPVTASIVFMLGGTAGIIFVGILAIVGSIK